MVDAWLWCGYFGGRRKGWQLKLQDLCVGWGGAEGKEVILVIPAQLVGHSPQCFMHPEPQVTPCVFSCIVCHCGNSRMGNTGRPRNPPFLSEFPPATLTGRGGV